MQFLYCEEGGKERITLKGEVYNYLFKVRRQKAENPIYIRDPRNPKELYRYIVESIERRRAEIKLISQESSFIEPLKSISLGWCVVDSKTIEKTLPMVNELGVKEIIFIYCDYSQKDIKLDFDRFERILQSSSMQSGRYDTPKMEILNSVEKFLERDLETIAIDFSEEKLEKSEKDNLSLLIGAEGGFSEEERKMFKTVKGLNSPYILRSQTAVVSAISSLL